MEEADDEIRQWANTVDIRIGQETQLGKERIKTALASLHFPVQRLQVRPCVEGGSPGLYARQRSIVSQRTSISLTAPPGLTERN